MLMFPAVATVTVVALWWELGRNQGWGWRDLGVTRPTRSLWHLLWEIPVGIMVSATIAALLGSLLGIGPKGPGSMDTALQSGELSLLVAVFVFVAGSVVIPVTEEIYYRRIVLDWLGSRTPAVWAIGVSGVFFARVHIAPAAIIFIIALGIIMALQYRWRGSFWASVIMHAANNTLVSLIGR